eukprot:Clim_evm104s109 gene=Clim_evmTU104s109
MTPAEVLALVNALNSQNFDSLRASGFTIAAQKYFFLRNDEGRSIYGKSKEGGCTVVKTNQCVILGVFDGSIQPGQCTTRVESLADYLLENGF